MTIPVLHPITLKVRLPSQTILAEALGAYEAARMIEKAFPSDKTRNAANGAYIAFVRACAKTDPSSLREPSVYQWAMRRVGL